MSAAAVIADAAVAGDAVPVKRRSKKTLILGAAILAVVLAIAGGTVWYLKKRAAHAVAEALAADGAAAEAAPVAEHAEAKGPPIYVPLDPFVVNLADKDVDRYAQIGITLEVENPAFADQVKSYMPAVRNAILLVLAHKTARDLLGRAGKEDLAEEVMREAVRPMGIQIAVPDPVTPAPVAVPASASASGAASGVVVAEEAASRPVKVARKRAETTRNPIVHVHFSSFIIQ
jgi:flagellar FliL protein